MATTGTNGINLNNSVTNSQAVSNAVKSALGKDDFLKLLTTELRNQDPLQAMDNKEFVSQMAQFSSLEVMSNVASAIESLQSVLTWQNQQALLVQGAALIGKKVEGFDGDGQTIQGTVEAVKLNDNNNIELQMGKTTILLANVTSVTP